MSNNLTLPYQSAEETFIFVTFYFHKETSDTARYKTVIIMTPYLGCFVFQHDSDVLNQPRQLAPFHQDICTLLKITNTTGTI